MTARRSSATERRGIAVSWRRPTAMLLALSAATTVAAGAAGCASRQSSTGQLVGKTLPGNQDTAAAQRQLAAPPTTPPGQSTPYGHSSSPGNPYNPGHAPATPIPSTSGPWSNDPDAAQGMATLLTQAGPVMGMTPEQNPAPAPKAALEIIGMPMWLWIEAPALQTTVANHTVTDQVVIDKVVWQMDGAALQTCGNPGGSPAPGLGPGIPYDTTLNPTDAAANPQACMYTFTAPYYTTVNGVTAEATRTLTAVADWHVEYTVKDNGTGVVTGPALVPGTTALAVPAPGNRTVRVGEIQALVIGP